MFVTYIMFLVKCYVLCHSPYATLTERHASGITILTWVSSANVKAKLEILLGIGWIK